MAEHTTRTGRRRGVLVGVVGLLAGLGLLSAGFAQDGGPRDTSRVCQAPYESDFGDIAGSVHAAVIRCLADYGITQGRADGSYGPGLEVGRDQMASFVARFLETATGQALPVGEARFADVAADSPHAGAIASLAEIGVVQGVSKGRYAPAETVSRAQMASFIRRAIAYLDDGQATNASKPDTDPDAGFGDVADDSVHAEAVAALASHGIVAGFTDGTYRPAQPVTRAQMAAFVMRGFDYAAEHDLTATHTDQADDPDKDGDTGDEGDDTSDESDDTGEGEGEEGDTDEDDDTGDGGETDEGNETGDGEGGGDSGDEGEPGDEPGGLAGTVTDTDNQPLQGATVTVEDLDDATATTDDQGGYTIERLPAGEHTVTAEADGHQAETGQATVQAGQTTTGIDFTLTPKPGAITGTVTDTDDQPLAGATVTIEDLDNATTTNTDGTYTIDDLPPGEHDVIATADGHYAHTESGVTVAPGATRELDIALLAVETYPCTPHDNTCVLPDDTEFDQQWGLYNTGQQVDGTSGTTGADISAPWAWQTTTGSREVVVGVLDSGIRDDHPDLEANMWTNPGDVGRCEEGTHGYRATLGTCDTSDGSHGTSVAGVLGAIGNNDEGVAGVAWEVSLMDLQITELGMGISTGVVMDAIDWAVAARRDHGINVRVLNLSYGTGGSDELRGKIKEAGEEGILVVTAAGNSSRDVDEEPVYPCSFDLPNLLCAAGSSPDDELWSGSNWGAEAPDLAAPAEKIHTTGGGGTYRTVSGTSFSAPFVSGVAALLWSREPDLTVEEVRARIVDNVDVLESLEDKVASGGRLNAYRALNPPTATNGDDTMDTATTSTGGHDGADDANDGAGDASAAGPRAPGGLVLTSAGGDGRDDSCGLGEGAPRPSAYVRGQSARHCSRTRSRPGACGGPRADG